MERLEPRTMFAGNGMLLANDAYLTLSFAADGTTVAGQNSGLAAKFDAIAPRAVWQDAILRAFQTWAVQTNADIGVIPDSGQAFGSAGATRSDARFGDVRIGAVAMEPLVAAEAIPLDQLVGGTWKADVVFNTNFDFHSVTDIYEVALHEAGHVFGLEHSSDPTSPMHGATIPTAIAPNSADTSALQTLYGTRLPDFNETDGSGSQTNNNSFGNATLLVVPNGPGFTAGSVPAIVYGDITSQADLDFFRLRIPDTYSGPVTIEVRTSGISLLRPQLRIYDEGQHILQDLVSTSTSGDALSFTLPSVAPNSQYYIEVSSAVADIYGTGGYALRALFVSVPQADLGVLLGYGDDTLRKLSQDEIRKLVVPSDDHFINEDAGGDDNLVNAVPLTSRTDFTDPSRYQVIGSISSLADSDYYRLRSPENVGTQANVMTVAVRTLAAGELIPNVNAFDRNLNPLPSTIIANGGGELVVQVAGIESDRNYYIQVSADSPNGVFGVGNYELTTSFRDQSASFQSFAEGTLAPGAQNTHTLYVAQPQLFHFLLQAGTAPATALAAVVATFYNEAGEIAYRIATPPGSARSQGAVLLAPGTYTLRITSLTFNGSIDSAISYQLSGFAISDPFASDPNDQTTHPFANPDPNLGGAYVYPGGIYTNDPYLWDSFIETLPNGPPIGDLQTQISLLIGDWWSWVWTQTGANGPPLAQADNYITSANTSLVATASSIRSLASNALLTVPTSAGLLRNDIDPEGGTMVAAIVTGPRNGTLQLNPNGSFQYTPEAGFNGVVQFTYQASDFTQLSNAATVYISVGLIGDYDNNGIVNQVDNNVWKSTFGSTDQLRADGNGDGIVDAADYVLWRNASQPAAAAMAASAEASMNVSGNVTPRAAALSTITASSGRSLSVESTSAVPAVSSNGSPQQQTMVPELPARASVRSSSVSNARRVSPARTPDEPLLSVLSRERRREQSIVQLSENDAPMDDVFSQIEVDSSTAALDQNISSMLAVHLVRHREGKRR